jgi:hypothetical protein
MGDREMRERERGERQKNLKMVRVFLGIHLLKIE